MLLRQKVFTDESLRAFIRLHEADPGHRRAGHQNPTLPDHRLNVIKPRSLPVGLYTVIWCEFAVVT